MAHVILYIATSLDGYIAKKDGSIDWLTMVEVGDTDYGYADFYQSVDALVMGSRTYEQALGFGDWPYPGKQSYVFTTRNLTSERKDVIFTSAKPDTGIREMEAQGFTRIWLVGGAELTAVFLRLRLVEEDRISVVSASLGGGIPLFLPPLTEEKLKLVELQQ